MTYLGIGIAARRGGGGIGPELLVNGDFEAGATGWTVTGEDVTHIATFAGGTLRYQSDTITPQLNVAQNTPITLGRRYRATFVVSAVVSGGLRSDIFPGIAITAAGTFTFEGLAASPSFNITRSIANTDVTLASVSLREIFS